MMIGIKTRSTRALPASLTAGRTAAYVFAFLLVAFGAPLAHAAPTPKTIPVKSGLPATPT